MICAPCQPHPSTDAADVPFGVRVDDAGADYILHVSGQLDMGSRAVIVRACADGGRRTLLIDLDELTFMDCAGYGALVAAQGAADARGGSLVIVNARGEPAHLLELVEGIKQSI